VMPASRLSEHSTGLALHGERPTADPGGYRPAEAWRWGWPDALWGVRAPASSRRAYGVPALPSVVGHSRAA
jgi:hypothetical protein